MPEQYITALGALLGGVGFIGGLAVVLLLFLDYGKGYIIFPAIVGGLVYLLLMTVVSGAERTLLVVGPPLGICAGMLSLFVVCALGDAVQRWRQGPGGVRIPGQGIVTGPFATMEEAQRYAYHQAACVVRYNPWLNPSSMRYVVIAWLVLGFLIYVLFILG